MTSGGGVEGSGTAITLVSVLGQPAGGTATNSSTALAGGFLYTAPPLPPGTRTIAVDGTISEPVASVVVNGLPATVTNLTFHAEGIQLIEGPNTIAATATDLAGNRATTSITVYLDTQPPPMPTVSTHLDVITASTYTLCGTKTPGTSIWINGTNVVPLNEATSWCATVSSLGEGDNLLTIVAEDAAGNPSSPTVANIIVDNLPPVISNLAYFDVNGVPLNLDPTTKLPKTNFSPVTITGDVDDSLTTVVINGITANRSGRTFQVAVPLTLGPNALSLVATSPLGHVTTQTLQVILGTIPTITTVQPPDGTKPYAGTTVTVQITATDAENDPLQYQVLLDGTIVMDWTSTNSYSWSPTLNNLGLHTLEARARDGFGGFASQPVDVYVVRQPVSPP